MSSSIDSGAGREHIKDRCPKSPTSKHKFKVKSGLWPSQLMECKYCKETFYTK